MTATIPGGYWLDGTCRRQVQLRAPSGADHAYLVRDAASLLPTQWTTEALTRCVSAVGDVEPVTREVVRSLTVGDREALLLHLHRLTSGDAARSTVTCPLPACGERLDVDLTVSQLLLPEYATTREIHELTVRDEDREYRVRFRLPTGRDQERASVVARRDLTLAADLLLQDCVESITGLDGAIVDRVPGVLHDQLASAMSQLDPQAELTLAVTCAACGHQFSAVFDAASYLFHEFRHGIRMLERDRHLLAFHYHWSPSEILAMASHDRRRCVAMLEEELSRGAAL